jgi:pilin isopeptide linkage protein
MDISTLASNQIVGTDMDLRGAIQVAGTSPQTIELSNDIILSGRQIEIPSGSNITLTGNGLYNIDANKASRAIYVNAGGSLSLKDIGITGGNAGSSDSNTGRGGGILNDGSLTLYAGSRIYENTASEDGGGVTTRESLMIRGGIVENNTAKQGGGVSNNKGSFLIDSGSINNNSADQYGGGIYNLDRLDIKGGSIDGNTAPTGGGIDNGGALNMSDGAISHNSAPQGTAGTGGTGGGIANEMFGSISISGGKIDGNRADNGGGIFIQYKDLKKLTIGAGAVFANNSAKTAYDRNPSDNQVYDEQIKGTKWTAPFTQGYNNYDISYTKGALIENVVKAAVNAVVVGIGGDIEPGQVILGLFDSSGNLISEKSNDANGLVNFDDLSYLVPGTYTYAIKETENAAGSQTVFPVVVTVTAGLDGKLTASVDYPNGMPIFESINSQNGTSIIKFDCLTISEPGKYEYTIKEDSPSGNGWTTDAREYKVTVTVADDGNGNLIPSVSYPNGFPEFIDTYNANPTNVIITAMKQTTGKALKGDDFQFGLFDENGKLISDAHNDKDGSVIFPSISYTVAGTYHLIIKELTASGNGWITDTEEYPVDITISDDGAGNLKATINYTKGKAVFKNTYSVKSVTVCPSANKTAIGADMTAGQFKFGVYDSNGKKVSSGTNQAGKDRAAWSHE